ncbi:metallophosphoesterase [Paenibacillus sediminis]|uniref:MPP superfamily phosphohydrolase n=1 Tax=Paenibacillus sediminis TaxID=664909 RepID=A0ABS4H764_9BACL|nr:metallophosphoesterase [Paenibacillus sediminis]MBP1937900.1 putative MPP superfamily phosphohydrolase [Paenibacillus sediminis]
MTLDTERGTPSRNEWLQTRNSRKISRRQFIRRSLGAAALAAGAIGLYGSLWETKALEVTRLTLTFPKLPAVFHGMTIVHFSDVHLGFATGRRELERVVLQIEKARPDLICFTGDIVDHEASEMIDCMDLLSRLQAPFGKYAVLGNHDYDKNGEEVRMNLSEAGFKVLINENDRIVKDSDSIFIAGLNDGLLRVPRMDLASEGIPEDGFKILLMHEPDFADEADLYSIQVQLSGHSHGGQVRLPWIGALHTPQGSHKYDQGLYSIGNNGMKLYVNRGIGTTRLPIRLLCKPELTIIQLNAY